jgi:hypothetical protein
MKFASIPILLLAASALVGTVTTAGTAQAEESKQSGSWKFRANVYGWLPDAPATISVEGNTVVDVPEDLGTILDDAEALAMVEFEAQKGKLWLFTDIIYYKGEEDDKFTGPVLGTPRKFTLEEEVTFIKYGAGYEFGPWDAGNNNLSTLTLTPWVGSVYFHDDWSVKVSPKNDPGGGRVSGTFEFHTPMVGVVSRSELAKNWDLTLDYGYGGWGVDDVDEIYDFYGGINHSFKMGDVPTDAFFGYRYLYLDWKDSPEELRLTIKGPFVGIGWEFQLEIGSVWLRSNDVSDNRKLDRKSVV